MNTRNKKLMTTLIAIFTLVVVAGSAFAFTSAGPLVFRGQANVDARLQLQIVDYSVNHSFGWGVDDRTEVFVYPHLRRAHFYVDFDQPRQWAAFRFTVENTGTMPAHFTGADVLPLEINFETDATYFYNIEDVIVRYAWGQTNAWLDLPPDGLVMAVGDTIVIEAHVSFFHGYPPVQADFNGSFLRGHVRSTLELNYQFPLS